MNEPMILRLLAEEGAARCCYLPGAGNPEKWPTSICDCKFCSDDSVNSTSEHTGCCEIRSAYRIIREGLRTKSDHAQPEPYDPATW